MIKLSQEHLQTICAHAENTYPEECCGIILGILAFFGKTVVEIMPTDNAWNAEAADFPGDETSSGQTRRYAIAPPVMLQVEKVAQLRQVNIIGIYHSHPDYPAIPSEFDRLYAWQEYSYIIVSLQNGKAGEIKSWSLDDNHQFQQEEIQITTPH